MYALSAALPDLGMMVELLVVGMVILGKGNGAVFQLVPQRFRSEIGIATGVVGAVGGLGGFLLPPILGGMKQRTRSFSTGFAELVVMVLRVLVTVRGAGGCPGNSPPSALRRSSPSASTKHRKRTKAQKRDRLSDSLSLFCRSLSCAL